MDRKSRSLDVLTLSFPRTRGDGPVNRTHSSGRCRFPPHARGWTGREMRELPDLGVSPARAGMDRTRGTGGIPTRRFPRTRGDGPAYREFGGDAGQFPPHARGWTQIAGTGEALLDVSPARAGMDRIEPLYQYIEDGFPRTRGDGPDTWDGWDTNETFPPHARGWTCVSRVWWGRWPVSPARAGMDPGSRAV